MVCLFYYVFSLGSFFFFMLGIEPGASHILASVLPASPADCGRPLVSDLYFTINIFPRRTGHHFHNFISWQDLRAAELVKSWNNSLVMKVSF